MGSIGFSEIMVVLVLALLVLGPDRLPEAAKTVGRWYGQFKRMTTDLQGEVQGVMDEVVTPFNDAINEGMAAAGTATGVTSQSQADAHAVSTSSSASSESTTSSTNATTAVAKAPLAPPLLGTPGSSAVVGDGSGGGALRGVLGGALPTSADDVWKGLGGKPAPAPEPAATTSTAPLGAAGGGPDGDPASFLLGSTPSSTPAPADFDPSLN